MDQILELRLRHAGNERYPLDRLFLQDADKVIDIGAAGRERPVVGNKVVSYEEDRDIRLEPEQVREHIVSLFYIGRYLRVGRGIEARVRDGRRELCDHPGQAFVKIKFCHVASPSNSNSQISNLKSKITNNHQRPDLNNQTVWKTNQKIQEKG